METPSYEVTRKLGSVEIRKYPEMILARAEGDTDLFGLLFRYISGANNGGQKISMTSPVVTDADSMSFIVPSKYTRETVPEPTDPHITIIEQPSRLLAVIRFSGWARDSKVENMKQILLETLRSNKVETEGDIIVMRYNPPFTPWFLRRNEVAIEVNDQ